jgi:DnaJ-class molecular chaperone
MIKGYAMLGIPKDATRKDTKKAWRCAPRCFIPEWGKSPITTG